MDDPESNGHGPRGGRWVTDGGRMRWESANEQVSQQTGFMEDDESDSRLDAIDEELWAGDAPPIPHGAPESARVRAALAWLSRQIDELHERAGELALIERERQQQSENDAPTSRRRREVTPPSVTTIALAEIDAAAAWFEDAREVLQEYADRSLGRALTEWYLWLLMESTPGDTPTDPVAAARALGRAEACERARQHAERLTQPEEDD